MSKYHKIGLPFSDHAGHYCYNCLDIDLLGSDSPSKDDPSYHIFYDLRVEHMFDGVDPGSCESPTMKKCDAEQSCFFLQATPETICRFNPLTAKLFSLNFHPLEIVSR